MLNHQNNHFKTSCSNLILNPGAGHYKKLGSSLWLFLYLLLKSDCKTGIVVRNYATISQEMGVKKKTIIKWMNKLKHGQYIQTHRESHAQVIHIKDWKHFCECPNQGTHSAVSTTNRVDSEQKNDDDVNNVNNIYLNNVKYVNDNHLKSKFMDYSFKRRKFIPQTKEELLALDIAQGLDDLKSLKAYISLCNRCPEPILRRIFEEVKEIPSKKIKRSRGALFTYLIKTICLKQKDQ